MAEQTRVSHRKFDGSSEGGALTCHSAASENTSSGKIHHIPPHTTVFLPPRGDIERRRGAVRIGRFFSFFLVLASKVVRLLKQDEQHSEVNKVFTVVSSGLSLFFSLLHPHRAETHRMSSKAHNSNNIAFARRTVQQLRIEASIERIKVQRERREGPQT